MEITEVRIKLMDDPHDRLQAFCSVTFDNCFVVRDLKIIQGTKGSFVAMPSRKLTDRCPKCHTKNHLRALSCNQCGVRLEEDRASKDTDGRARLYADIAHPINSVCREMIQQGVIQAFGEELIKSKQPGYICTYDDFGEENYATLSEPEDVVDQQPIIVETAEATHRIEPAASQPVSAPHLTTPVKQESTTTAQQPAGSNGSEDGGFGEGIV